MILQSLGLHVIGVTVSSQQAGSTNRFKVSSVAVKKNDVKVTESKSNRKPCTLRQLVFMT